MSTHRIPVIEITDILPHPNADRLEIIPIHGWQCIVEKGSFKPGDLAAYVEPDYMVPVTEYPFAFLKDPSKFDQTHVRIKAKRLRGEWSYGLLVHAPRVYRHDAEVKVGHNLLEYYDIHRWEPPMNKAVAADTLSYDHWPKVNEARSKFDLENLNNFTEVFSEQDTVIVTEKVHGANARYLFLDGEMYVGSRTRWLKRGEKPDAWHHALDNTLVTIEKFGGDAQVSAIQMWCEENPGVILYGEVYGNVQDLKYGLQNRINFVGFAAFDTNTGHWIDSMPLFDSLYQGCVPHVPILAICKFDMGYIKASAEGDSYIKSAPRGHMREGVVVTSYNETTHPSIGRKSLKYVSNRYLTREL